MAISKEEVLKIVDRCFHKYASIFRNEAKEDASKMIKDLEELKNLPIDVVSKPLVGQKIVITDCIEGHRFAIGEEVTIIESHDNITFKAKRENGDYWWINKNEFTAC